MPKKRSVAIIDHGYCNIASLSNTLSYLDFSVRVISNIGEAVDSQLIDGFILPGVGSFSHAMQSMYSRELDSVVENYIQKKVKCLGICLGMQMLASSSEECQFNTKGLNYFSARVLRLSSDHEPVPNISWCTTSPTSIVPQSIADILSGDFYYVHSFAYDIADPASIAATIQHDRKKAVAAIYKENLLGVQFHPEKSQTAGLELLNTYFVPKF